MPQVFRSAYENGTDRQSGKRPVVFDIIAPDKESSLLPDDIKLVMHVNPRNLNIKLTREATRIQTRGGFVEQHWGDAAESVDFSAATGGFMRLYAGLSSMTGGKYGGSRRQTIAYDKYLDMLTLFHNNGSVVDASGHVVLQGYIKMSFDGGTWLGWFSDFSVTESAENPYMFEMSGTMQIDQEIQTFKSRLNRYQVNTTSRGLSRTEGALPATYGSGI